MCVCGGGGGGGGVCVVSKDASKYSTLLKSLDLLSSGFGRIL